MILEKIQEDLEQAFLQDQEMQGNLCEEYLTWFELHFPNTYSTLNDIVESTEEEYLDMFIATPDEDEEEADYAQE